MNDDREKRNFLYYIFQNTKVILKFKGYIEPNTTQKESPFLIQLLKFLIIIRKHVWSLGDDF